MDDETKLLARRAASRLAGRRRGSPEDDAQTAALLLSLLAEGREGLSADERMRFVREVLELGYPWALELDPDDVAAARAVPARRRRWWPAVLAGVAVVVAVASFSPAAPASASRLDAPPSLQGEEESETGRRAQRIVFDDPLEIAGSPELKPEPRTRSSSPPFTRRAFASLAAAGDWETIIERGDACRRDDPFDLDCILEGALAHAKLAERAPAGELRPLDRRLAEVTVTEHERAARALLRRYLSVAPSSDPRAPKIVRLLRDRGDWVEWDPTAADRELAALASAPGGDCFGLYMYTAEAFEERALRTRHPDDLGHLRALEATAFKVLGCSRRRFDHSCPCVDRNEVGF